MKKKKIFDYFQLRWLINKKYGTTTEFLKKINMSYPTFISKIKCDVYFNQGDIEKIIRALGLELSDIPVYFFYEKS